MPGRHLGLRCHGEATHPLPAGTPPRQGCPLSLVTLNKFAAAESDNGSSPSTRAFKGAFPGHQANSSAEPARQCGSGAAALEGQWSKRPATRTAAALARPPPPLIPGGGPGVLHIF